MYEKRRGGLSTSPPEPFGLVIGELAATAESEEAQGERPDQAEGSRFGNDRSDHDELELVVAARQWKVFDPQSRRIVEEQFAVRSSGWINACAVSDDFNAARDRSNRWNSTRVVAGLGGAATNHRESLLGINCLVLQNQIEWRTEGKVQDIGQSRVCGVTSADGSVVGRDRTGEAEWAGSGYGDVNRSKDIIKGLAARRSSMGVARELEPLHIGETRKRGSSETDDKSQGNNDTSKGSSTHSRKLQIFCLTV